MIDYNIQESLFALPDNGWGHIELNMISWNGSPAKYDLRRWNKDRNEPRKGFTLTAEELITLKELLQEVEL